MEFESIWGFECYFHYFSFSVDFDKGKQKIRRPLSINTAKPINQPNHHPTQMASWDFPH